MGKIDDLNAFIIYLNIITFIIAGIVNYKKQKKEKNPSPGANTFKFVFVLWLITRISYYIGGVIGNIIGFIIIIVISLLRFDPSDKKPKSK